MQGHNFLVRACIWIHSASISIEGKKSSQIDAYKSFRKCIAQYLNLQLFTYCHYKALLDTKKKKKIINSNLFLKQGSLTLSVWLLLLGLVAWFFGGEKKTVCSVNVFLSSSSSNQASLPKSFYIMLQNCTSLHLVPYHSFAKKLPICFSLKGKVPLTGQVSK